MKHFQIFIKRHFIKKSTFDKTIFLIKKAFLQKNSMKMNSFYKKVKLLVVFLEKFVRVQISKIVKKAKVKKIKYR